MAEQNYTFFKFMNDLIDSGIWAELSSAARALYPVLCRFSDETFKYVWPGTDELLRLTGFKQKRSLQLAKKELAEKGLIDIIPGSGRSSTRYYFRFDYPNSKININDYRDKIISRRRLYEYPPEGYNPTPQGNTHLSPNQIHININQNNQQQERLLENLQNLLQQFLENLPQPKAENYKQQIISKMLSKYGELEVGEAIRIAIEKGKDGDIRYLEGILRNRKSDTEKIEKNNHKKIYNSKQNSASENKLNKIKSLLKNNLTSNWGPLIEELNYRYHFEGTTYLTHPDSLAAKLLEAEALKQNLSIVISSNNYEDISENKIS